LKTLEARDGRKQAEGRGLTFELAAASLGQKSKKRSASKKSKSTSILFATRSIQHNETVFTLLADLAAVVGGA
jgi:hypothetical protein